MTVFVLVLTHLPSLAAFANGSPNFSNSETGLPLSVVVVVVVFAGRNEEEQRGDSHHMPRNGKKKMWKKGDCKFSMKCNPDKTFIEGLTIPLSSPNMVILWGVKKDIIPFQYNFFLFYPFSPSHFFFTGTTVVIHGIQVHTTKRRLWKKCGCTSQF